MKLRELEFIKNDVPLSEVAKFIKACGFNPESVSEIHLADGEAKFTLWMRDENGEIAFKGNSAVSVIVTLPITVGGNA